MKREKQQFLIPENYSVKQAMSRISEIGQKGLFVIDKNGRLAGSLSDGDIRKWILAGGELNKPVIEMCNKKPHVVESNYSLAKVKDLILKLLIDTVPVVNEKREVIKVLTWEDVFSEKDGRKKDPLGAQVVIMAGGKGTRLDPFTRILPKPLIPIGEKPIIEVIMDKFGEYGVKEFFISINHKSRMIRSYFEEANHAYRISYIEEKKPLGTAGSLKLLGNKVKGPVLVTNCDTLIEADCAEIVKFHKANAHDMTLIVSCKHYTIPFGVCEIENGGALKRINEKPEYDLLVNTGMYLINKNVLSLIPANRYFNINDLTTKAIKQGLKLGVFPVSEKDWIDIGQWDEYRKAIERMGLK